jgi:hypothetical protein
MNEERQMKGTGTGGEKDRKMSSGREGEEIKGRDSNQQFAWYGGKVNREIVREIVRLKREHKL